MAGKDGGTWLHGYIPTNMPAARLKAHGSSSGAQKAYKAGIQASEARRFARYKKEQAKLRPAGTALVSAKKPKPPQVKGDRRQVSTANKYASATDAQMKHIDALAKKGGYRSASAARAAMNGKNRVGSMKRDEASRLIDFLKTKK